MCSYHNDTKIKNIIGEKLIILFKNYFPGDVKYLLDNKYISSELIDKYLIDEWNLSMEKYRNPNITIEWIEKYPNKKWDWITMSRTCDLTMEFLDKYGEHLKWFMIASNRSLKIEWIEKYPDKDWVWGAFAMSLNPSITLEFLDKYYDKEWAWGGFNGLSTNPAITIE